MAKILTTTDLVNTSLRRASIPKEEAAFTTQDIIDILNEEMQSYIMPMILRLHEDFYLHDEDVPLLANIKTYKIPYRSTGNKLYDVQFQSNQNSLYEMVRVPAGSRVDYSGYYNSGTNFKYYVKGDSITLLTDNINTTGSLLFSYFLRPNDLVKDNRGSSVVSISADISNGTITNYSNLIGDTLTINGIAFTGVSTITAPKQFLVDIDTITTATNLANAINSDSESNAIVTVSTSDSKFVIRALSSSTELSVSYDNNSNIGMTLTNIKKELTIDQFPAHFSTTTKFDFIQGNSPSKIQKFDKIGAAIKSSDLLVIFDKDDVPTDLSIGDYIMKANECVTAQIPTELQPLLAQKVACKLLEAIGDTDGVKVSLNELDRLESNLNTLIDTRVDESIVKVNNRHTSLREFTKGRGSSRGY